jgi:hypothetical protein
LSARLRGLRGNENDGAGKVDRQRVELNAEAVPAAVPPGGPDARPDGLGVFAILDGVYEKAPATIPGLGTVTTWGWGEMAAIIRQLVVAACRKVQAR